MADNGPLSGPGAADRPTGQDEPPSLDAIRVKGPGAKGLNKPAVIAVAGAGVAVVLVLASGVVSDGEARKPAEIKPLMSDPARPEAAKGAIRALPADYGQVEAMKPPSAHVPAQAPLLGPPLAGDVAAFAQPHSGLRSRIEPAEPGWADPGAHDPAALETPLEREARDAERSGLFFALRDAPKTGAVPDWQAAAQTSPFAPIPQVSPAPADARNSEADSGGVLFPGAVIPASLVTAVNSESPGPVVAQVTQAVYDSPTGRSLLIPQGARLIGDYRASSRYGQSRIAIVWASLIMPDGREVMLTEAAVDPSGSAGVPGEVDNHWSDVFGAAALGTFINVGVAATEDPQLAYGSMGVAGRDPVDAAISEGVQRTASQVTNRVIDRGLSIAPAIRVPAGARLSVIVTRQMSLQARADFQTVF